MNLTDYLVVGVYAAAFIGIGFLFRQQHDKEDYFLGGRSFGWFPLSLSVMATQLSAISFISAPAFVGMREGGGLLWLSYEFAVPLAMIFLATFLIPPLYRSGVVSIYAYLEKRFGVSTRLLLSLVFQVSRAFATAVMIYAVSLIIMSVMDIPFWMTIIVIGIVTLIYSYQGGMKAVVYGDMIQMIILFGGILICLFYALDLQGGWTAFTENVSQERLLAVDFSSFGFREGEEFGFWPMLVGGFFLYASYYGTDQSQVQRLLSANPLQTVRKTLFFNGILRFPITLSYCIMGLVLGSLALSTPDLLAKIPSDKPDLLVPVFIRDYLPHGIIGILIVAILSAAMSSLSSTINSLSAVTTEDFILRGKQVEPDQYVQYSRLTALLWGLVCIGLAFYAGDIAPTVIEAINKIGSVFYGPILATFLVALKIRSIGARGMNAGLLAGVAVNVFMWLVVGDQVFWFWWNAIGFFFSLAVARAVQTLAGSRAVATSEGTGVEEPLWTRWNVMLTVYFFLMIFISLSLRYWLT